MKSYKTKIRVFWLPLLLSAVVGCGDGGTESNEPTAPDEETLDDPSSTDPSEPVDSDPSSPEPSDADPADVDPSDSDPSEPNLEGTLCTPQPIREDGLELTNLWELFRVAREEGCYLESYSESLDNTEQWTAGEALEPAETDWDCNDEGCRRYKGQIQLAWELEADEFGWHSRPDLALGTLKVFEMSEAGENKWDVNLEYVRNGSTATYRLERQYDAQGNIRFERTYFQFDLRKEITNTFEQGHLVSQEVHEELGNGNSTIRLRTWTYDADGMMVESTYQRAQQSVFSATFSYDDERRVIGIERSQDGVRFLMQDWVFEDAKLVNRTSVMEGPVYYDGADSFLPNMRDGYSAHWEDAGSRIGQGGCEQVPTSLWHGYPESDEVYVLGWKMDDVPNSIGFGYGYDGFGFQYGDYSWMGHGGIASSYESSQMIEATRVQTTMTYDSKGRMVEETLSSEAPWGEDTSSAQVTRSRLFEDDVMVEDSITAQSNSGEMVNFENQTLTFSYDLDGKLIERSAQSDGVTTDQSTWTYDEEGRIHEHVIYGLYWNSNPDVDVSNGLPMSGAFRDVYSVAGQTQERRREKKDVQSGEWMLQRTESVTQMESGELERDEHFNSYLIRDFAGVLTEVGYGDVDEPSMFLRIQLDSMNWVRESGRLGSGDMGAVFRRYTYQCSDQ